MCGVVLAAVIVFFIDTAIPSAWHQLWLPLGLTVAALLMTRAAMAVAFAACALSAANTDFDANNWIVSVAYPGIAIASLSICCVIGIKRFKQRIAATHEARWAARERGDNSAAQDKEPIDQQS
jgi:hypothetical protein